MTLLIFYASLALVVSFLCSLLEASLLSVSVGYVNVLVERGAPGAKLMHLHKSSPDRALAAILSSNTVAHTVGAAGVGAQVTSIWGDRWLGLASGLLTIVILLLTEIVPKTLGTLNANRLVGFTAPVVQGMIYLLYPLVLAAEFVGRLVAGGDRGLTITRDEVAALADLGKQGGSLSPAEARAIRNLLSLRTIRVSDIMTPRPVVEALDADTTVGEFADSDRETFFARMPVTEGGNIDDVIGVIHRSMILDAVREQRLDERFRGMVRPLEAVPSGATASKALEMLLAQTEHMLLVVDEYGGMAGVLTLEDVLETLLGVEIVDETDRAVDMRELARALHRRRQN
ncbi:MAG: CNNM domain-containing protein [Gemmatimonadota bacterium]|nr:CNNM domain-containing protein [Gemmatimonadota bacterium]